LLSRLGHRHGLPIREGNQVALVEGPGWLEATQALIRGAGREICFEMYIWEDDPVGRRVLGWLREAAHRGVRVRGILDGLGSFGADGMIRDLRESGGDVRRFHPVAAWRPLRAWNRRNHRKLLLVDGEEALVGSANWGMDYDPAANDHAFFDLGVAMRGPSVPDLVEDFEQVWRECGGARPSPLPFQATSAPRWPGPWVGPASVQIVTAITWRGRRALRRHLELLVQQAATELWIANAYFIPGARLVRFLRRAANRGVDLRLLLPGRTDQPFVQAAGRHTHGPLLRAGAMILERPHRMLHAKAAVVDGHWVLIGSANLDPRSLRHNQELNLVLEHPAILDRVRDLFLEEAGKSQTVRLAEWEQRPWLDRLWQQLAYACRWWL
jgi:cardiolipin synthase